MHNEFVTNLLGVDEFHKEANGRLRFWYEHIRQNPDIEGDIFEFGVYRGASLIAAALILKEMNS
ncbi:methyltransferase, partial [Gammaproteobacteria bacterium]|nr:methyltransferase [Gammaproteobacteria bacterium]